MQGTATTGNQTSGITVETSGEIGKIQNEATQQLEIGGFGEVFNNPLFEVEEVE